MAPYNSTLSLSPSPSSLMFHPSVADPWLPPVQCSLLARLQDLSSQVLLRKDYIDDDIRRINQLIDQLTQLLHNPISCLSSSHISDHLSSSVEPGSVKSGHPLSNSLPDKSCANPRCEARRIIFSANKSASVLTDDPSVTVSRCMVHDELDSLRLENSRLKNHLEDTSVRFQCLQEENIKLHSELEYDRSILLNLKLRLIILEANLELANTTRTSLSNNCRDKSTQDISPNALLTWKSECDYFAKRCQNRGSLLRENTSQSTLLSPPNTPDRDSFTVKHAEQFSRRTTTPGFKPGSPQWTLDCDYEPCTPPTDWTRKLSRPGCHTAGMITSSAKGDSSPSLSDQNTLSVTSSPSLSASTSTVDYNTTTLKYTSSTDICSIPDKKQPILRPKQGIYQHAITQTEDTFTRQVLTTESLKHQSDIDSVSKRATDWNHKPRSMNLQPTTSNYRRISASYTWEQLRINLTGLLGLDASY